VWRVRKWDGPRYAIVAAVDGCGWFRLSSVANLARVQVAGSILDSSAIVKFWVAAGWMFV